MNKEEERAIIKADLANHWTPALVHEPFQANPLYRAKLIAQTVINEVIQTHIANGGKLMAVETFYADEATRRQVLMYMEETGWEAQWHSHDKGNDSWMLAVQEKKGDENAVKTESDIKGGAKPSDTKSGSI